MSEALWVEKYRPKTVADTILPDELKATFQQFVNNKSVPNLILSGGAGVGKTTIAKAMLEELGCNYIVVNGSLEGREIATLRTHILNFASGMSMYGGRKYVILDEADYLNPQSVQPALRNFMEEFSSNCGFILTCNYKNRIIDPLHSRCSTVEFKASGEEKLNMMAQMFKRVCDILTKEGVEFDQTAVGHIVKKYAPDNRRILNELQKYSATGKIDSGILANVKDITITDLVKLLKNKEFSGVRKWVADNMDNDVADMFRKIYDKSSEFMDNNNIPRLVLILADYQHRAAFVADQEINMVACLTEVMMECDLK